MRKSIILILTSLFTLIVAPLIVELLKDHISKPNEASKNTNQALLDTSPLSKNTNKNLESNATINKLDHSHYNEGNKQVINGNNNIQIQKSINY